MTPCLLDFLLIKRQLLFDYIIFDASGRPRSEGERRRSDPQAGV